MPSTAWQITPQPLSTLLTANDRMLKSIMTLALIRQVPHHSCLVDYVAWGYHSCDPSHCCSHVLPWTLAHSPQSGLDFLEEETIHAIDRMSAIDISGQIGSEVSCINNAISRETGCVVLVFKPWSWFLLVLCAAE